MASNIDLNINIGANVTDLQAQLQKSENLLKQFEAALKKATNVGEINYLNGQIKNLNTTISGLNQQMNKVGRPTSDATNALGNLSRVAQDAPYGFIGIANNLNPLLESFQRLQKESGGTGAALKSMLSGLTGPAGIGIALATISSLVVAFGDDISDFVKKTIFGTDAVKEHSKALFEGQKAYIDAYAEMYKLGNSFDDFHNGLISQKELLKRYNETLGDTYGKTNDVTEAEKIWESNSENFIKSAILRAAALSQIDKAAKKASEAFEQQQKPKEEFTSAFAFAGAGTGGAAAINLQKQTDRDRLNNQKKVVDGLKEEEKFHLQVAKTIEAELKLLDEKAIYSKFIGQELPKETKERQEQVDYGKELVKEMQSAQNASKAFMDNMKAVGLEIIKISGYTQTEEDQIKKMDEDRQKWAKKKRDELLESTQKEGGFGDYVTKKIAQDTAKINVEDTQKQKIIELTKAYNEFAYSLSQNVTNGLINVFDAMISGENVLKSIGDMFMNIAKQIAEAVIQATIFAAIMSILKPASAGGIGFVGSFFKLLGLAEGGIATGPTLAMIGEGKESEAVLPLSKLSGMLNTTFNAGAMSGGSVGQNGQFVLRGQDLVLALQRSNSALNLRR